MASCVSRSTASCNSFVGLLSMIPTPPLPNIVSEWASLIPLAVYLASHRFDHCLVGKVALHGHLSFGIFPKLGVFHGISRLLKHCPDFLDRASTRGSSSQTVWDVQWGSVFPCANDAASEMIANYAMSMVQQVIHMPETISRPSNEKNTTKNIAIEIPVPSQSSKLTMKSDAISITPSQSTKNVSTSEAARVAPTTSKSSFYRYQTLNILDFRRRNTIVSKNSGGNRFLSSAWFVSIDIILSISVAVMLCLLALYGSATATVICSISRLLCRRVKIQRPYGYLENNETHNGCMLASIHENALTWTLYTGDRGAVDTLLNKTLFDIPPMKGLSCWFNIAHILQLSAVTFAAASKSWDGIFLTMLMTISWIADWRFRGHRLAKGWLQAEGIDVHAGSYKFTGRTPMIGAIQILSKSKITLWMDNILVPHPRREAWLSRLTRGMEEEMEKGSMPELLTERDMQWVNLSADLAYEAAQIIKRNSR